MRLAVLTTETLHHAYFVRELAKTGDDLTVLCETETVKATFDTADPSDVLRDQYECDTWFDGAAKKLSDFADVRFWPSLNGDGAIAFLRRIDADAVVVFGTGRLRTEVISVKPDFFLNLHGGDPERYRGLDSHLWSIYHNDFDGLVTTFHRVDAELDTGDIILQGMVKLERGMELHMLRKANAEVCLDLTLAGLDMVRRQGAVVARKQRKKGRYYSFMPGVLKAQCATRFKLYCSNL